MRFKNGHTGKKRPREANRRQQIKEAAKELFVLKGFKFSTMEEIADKADHKNSYEQR